MSKEAAKVGKLEKPSKILGGYHTSTTINRTSQFSVTQTRVLDLQSIAACSDPS